MAETAAGPKRSASQGSKNRDPNTFNKHSPLMIVEVVFHSDRYRDPCRLHPHPGNENALSLLKRRLSEGDSTVKADAAGQVLAFPTTQIQKCQNQKNRWACIVLTDQLPLGKYFLEVTLERPGKDGKPVQRRIFQQLEVNGKMVARDGESGAPLGPSSSGGHPLANPPLLECLIGDGYSLEEALYSLISYRYENSLGVMREEDMRRVAEGDDPKSGFQTALGVAQTAQELVANLIGIVKVDFPFYDDLKLLDKYLNPNDRVAQRILSLWEKTGIAKSQLDWTKNLTKPNIDGILAFELDDAGNPVRKLKTLESLEANKLEGYRESLKNSGFGKFEQYVSLFGKILGYVGNVVDTLQMIETFRVADEAEHKLRGELTYAAGQICRVPSEGYPWSHSGPGWFTRGDLLMLESLKMHADNKSASAHVNGWKWTIKMASQAVGFCEYGELVKGLKHGEKVQDLYPVAQRVVQFADKELGRNWIETTINDIETSWHDAFAYATNSVTILHTLFGMSPPYEDQNRIVLLFHLRAKVLYGLKRLIDKCGPAVDMGNKPLAFGEYNYVHEVGDWVKKATSFQNAVEKYKIREYIHDLCLSERFWVRKDHLTEDWIHHYVSEEDSGHRNEVIRLADPKNADDWFEVDFQRYWPIHFMEHKDVAKFVELFSTDWSAVHDSDVERCFLQRGEAMWKTVPGSANKALEIDKWVKLKDSDVIDSETPVRAILLFKAAGRARTGLPVTFQVERTDGFNVAGPVYQTVARPVSVEESKALSITKGRLIAMTEFTYGYAYTPSGGKAEPPKIYHGLKPMVETDDWAGALMPWGFKARAAQQRRIFHSLVPQAMTMAVKYAAGDGSVTGYARLEDFWNSTVEVTVQPDRTTGPEDPRFSERNKAKFTDLKFLERQVAAAPPPPPEKPGVETAVLQYFDGKSWKQADVKRGVKTTEPVRVIIVFKKKVDRVPVVIQTVRTDYVANLCGPYYTANAVQSLDDFGFKGKWGAVITPEYYYVTWYKKEGGGWRIVFENDGQAIRGIKPVCKADSFKPVKPANWEGYTFDIRYAVGTNEPSEIDDDDLAQPDDCPLIVESTEDLLWTGAGVALSAADEKVDLRGSYYAASTMRVAGWVDEQAIRSGVYERQLSKLLEEYPDFMDIAVTARGSN